MFEVRQLLTETSNDGSLNTVKALTQAKGHNYNNYLNSMKPLSASDENLIIFRFLYRTDITVEKYFEGFHLDVTFYTQLCNGLLLQ